MIATQFEVATEPCVATGYCDATNAYVVYEQIDAGTVRLYSIDGCGQGPALAYDPDATGEAPQQTRFSCNFDGPAAPVVCDCACEGAPTGGSTG